MNASHEEPPMAEPRRRKHKRRPRQPVNGQRRWSFVTPVSIGQEFDDLMHHCPQAANQVGFFRLMITYLHQSWQQAGSPVFAATQMQIVPTTTTNILDAATSTAVTPPDSA